MITMGNKFYNLFPSDFLLMLRNAITKQNSASHWAPRRPLDHSKTTQTEMIRAHNKIFRACQDNPAGHSARREKTRQTEKEMGGQHPGMDGHDTGRRHEEG